MKSDKCVQLSGKKHILKEIDFPFVSGNYFIVQEKMTWEVHAGLIKLCVLHKSQF